MDPNQAKIIELLREVHLIAFKEIERLNLRIAELESRIANPRKCQSSGQQSTRHQPARPR